MIGLFQHQVIFLFLAWMVMPFVQTSTAQVAPGKYLVEFSTKQGTPFSIDKPEDFLSQRAINRRIRQQIQITETDLPVNPLFIDSLQKLGFRILSRSRWFNSAVVQSGDSLLIDTLGKLSFVRSYLKVSGAGYQKSSGVDKYAGELQLNNISSSHEDEMNSFYGKSFAQIKLHNGHYLHQQGFTGKGMQIALLDGNFNGVDRHPAFIPLHMNHRILGTRDFVELDNNVYTGYYHGMSVLSVIGGYIDGSLVGTAYDASFYLLRTEDEGSEYRIEEENWIAGAEYADSAGADVINSSLGYSWFTDAAQNYFYQDMNGVTARISAAATLVFSKGVFVCTSAGNQGNTPWYYITAPADARNIYSVGATDLYGNLALFSSAGPSYDRRIKPEGMAMGLNVICQKSDGSTGPGSGTSFASPIMAGSVACLWQKHPDAAASQIKEAIIQSSSYYDAPSERMGYGIPDFKKADEILSVAESNSLNSNTPVMAYPNPFSNYFMVAFYTPDSAINITLHDLKGRLVYEKNYGSTKHSFVFVAPGFELHDGLYIMTVNGTRYHEKLKIIKRP